MTNTLKNSSELIPAASRAYHELERQIVTLELTPGSFVTEGSLIERTGLGRTPVREAIQRLSWEGLMSVRPRAGLQIAPLDPADWPRILETRKGPEIILARSAARLMSETMAVRFQEALDGLDQSATENNIGDFLEADKMLDDALAEITDNPFAARVAAPLQAHSRRFWFRYRAPDAIDESAAGHMEMIRAILDKDEDKAAEVTGRLIDLLMRLALQQRG
ncbi:MAG: GntR family transcriptional regulator [Rhizobiaceae bacterium]|nr:GntR family transcriptional regulator [Rhizobiaceae bacterium]